MEQIVLYSNGCPKCRVIKSKLESKKIKFIETDDTQKLLSFGYKAYPVLKVNDKMMDFVSANAWVNERSETSGN